MLLRSHIIISNKNFLACSCCLVIIDQLDIEPLISKYKAGGTSSFHPRLLLKVLVFAYINNVYSSRKIEEAVSQNIPYMWLAGMNTPDHNTINRFRSERLKGVLTLIQ
jgi:transposase